MLLSAVFLDLALFTLAELLPHDAEGYYSDPVASRQWLHMAMEFSLGFSLEIKEVTTPPETNRLGMIGVIALDLAGRTRSYEKPTYRH